MAKIDHISYGGTNYEIVPAAGDLRDIVAPEFSDQSTYAAGSYVLKNGVLYKFTAAHSGAWTGTDAVVVTVGGELENKPTFPTQYEDVEFTENVGIVNRTNLVPFSNGSGYQGRYTSIPVNPGDVYSITCYSTNNTYPGCFGVVTGGTSAYIPLLLSGSAVAYTDTEITIPDTVTTIYVNANYPNVIKIKKKGYMTQTEFDSRIEKIQSIQSPDMYAKVDSDNNLLFKKKSNVNSKDLCMQMGHSSIGNNLFNFITMYYKSNLSTLDSDFTPEAGQASLSLSQTDWLSPYQMKAVSNADGDHPTSVYFTGGNHRSNNGSSGGGKTATENSLTILFDGVAPDINKVYGCKTIDVYVVNSVNGYNTSKDDGTGRNILQEKVHFRITAEKVDVERVLVPLENIVIERNYGLQVYYPSSTVRFIGGENRIPFTVSDNLTSGNKNVRDVIASGAFKIESGICDYDIGSFEFDSGAFSYFTSSNKVYSNIIYNNSVQFDANAEYRYKGYYKFN